MKTTVEFTKMHGAGNDYIYIDTCRFPISQPERLAISLSAYHTGIGSDGLVLIGKSDKADFSMRIFNADGSEALMCGNASRCIGRYVYENGLTTKKEITLDTLSGIKHIRLNVEGEQVQDVTVDMGVPSLLDIQGISVDNCSFAIEAGGRSYQATPISMGNPHLVIFIDDITTIDLPVIGPLLEHHPLFPDRINVEFAQIISKDVIRMKVWERGSGITMACGTGACATAVAAFMTNRCGKKCQVIMDGGSLTIEWDYKNSRHLYMTGEAVKVFDGKITLDQ